MIDGRQVTSASSFGRVVTDIDLVINRATGEMVSAVANNNIVTRDVPLDPFLTTLVTKYNALTAPLANRVIGSITADITRAASLIGGVPGESALGDVIADAQLAATSDPALGGAVVAFMNPGGIRDDLDFLQSAGEGDGNVTYGEAFTVQPFGNSLVTMTLTGTQIDALLEQQATAGSDGAGRILQISHTLTYSLNPAAPIGSRVDIAGIMINGVPIDPNASYRVTVNSFLADGGDGFTVLIQGTDRLGGEVDLDALVKYFEANSPVAPGPQNRITVIQ
jgi:5'-nucleotidase